MTRDAEQGYLTLDYGESDSESASLAQMRGSSITYRIAIGPQQGRKVFTLQTLPAHLDAFEDELSQVSGISLYASVFARADQPSGRPRKKLERLCLGGPAAISVARLLPRNDCH